MNTLITRRQRTVRRAGAVTAGSAAIAAASYWALMSSYSQLFGSFPYRGSREERLVALTFDDGPNDPYTSQIADFLREYDIKATFFQVGRCVERHPEMTLRLADEGHVIGNHSYSHQFSRCWNAATLRHEIARTQGILGQLLGRAPALYRPPWLLRTPVVFDILQAEGLHPVSGEFCHALEIFQPAPERIARRAVAKTRPGSVLIFHDGYDSHGGNRASTVDAVKVAVDRLSAAGYRFVTVDQLLGLPAYQG